MSWNKYGVIVSNVAESNLSDVVKKIGYDNLTPGNEVDFRTAISNRDGNKIFGLNNSWLWILIPDEVWRFFDDIVSVLEEKLVEHFPQATILAFAENATVYSFGFSLIKNGQRNRILYGCDGELQYEFGDEILEEREARQQLSAAISQDEKEEIVEAEGEEGWERHLMFESKWRVPFKLFEKLYGKSIDQVASENISFVSYA